MRIISVFPPALRRMGGAVYARRYGVACACLLIAAAGLRLHELPGHALRQDEIVAALNSRGTLLEVVANTRYHNTSPILYPLALWAVQQAWASELSVRVISAAGSVLTVWALLFVMPRVGVARRAAFAAGLLAAVSAAAIEHAQDAREYSVDALVAALMIAGLLQYLRDGKRALLCGALLVGPLLQYGLVLFGAAALGAAVVANTPPRMNVRNRRLAQRSGVWEWLKSRLGLLLPLGCFGTGCALSWVITAGYQYKGSGWGSARYLADFYYRGGLDAAAMAEFALGRTWSLLVFHMPWAVAAAALFAAALGLGLMRGRRLDAVGLLALWALGIAICGALLSAYPLGGGRQNLYLGPMVFLAAGCALHSVAGDAAAVLRRGWVAPALAIAAVAAIAVAGAAAIYQQRHYLYYPDDSAKRALATLEEHYREGDAVYVTLWEVPTIEFYRWRNPDGYFYGKAACWGPHASWGECFPEMLDEMFGALGEARRIWLIHNTSVSAGDGIAAYARAHSQDVMVEEFDAGGGVSSALGKRELGVWDDINVPDTTLHLITGHEGLAAQVRGDRLAVWDAAAAGEPSAVSEYELYLRGDALYYARRPCAAGDIDVRFFLHLYPLDGADLPARRRGSGFDNLDFEFGEYGLLAGDRCVIRRELPGYGIERVHTGQFVGDDVVWEAEIWVSP